MIEEHSKKSYTKIGEDEKKEEKMNNKTNDVLKKVNYKLIALDLDGTLTNDEKEIPEYTTRVLMRAQEQGVRIALVSARQSSGLHYERDVLKLQKYGGLLLSYNGGRIVEAENGNVLYETTLDPQVTKEILRYLEDLPVTVIMDDCDRLYVKDRNGYQVQQESYNDHMDVVEVPDLVEALTFPVVKLLLAVDPEIIFDVQKQIAEYLPDDLTVVRTAPFYLEIISKKISKGQGIRQVCEYIGIRPEEVIAFGDAENDISMIQVAGMGIAMGNAEPAVKEVADRITLTNNEDGIAVALEQILS